MRSEGPREDEKFVRSVYGWGPGNVDEKDDGLVGRGTVTVWDEEVLEPKEMSLPWKSHPEGTGDSST